MNGIELLYINFEQYNFFNNLEINFSQDLIFKLKDNNHLEVSKNPAINIFNNDDNILNFNMILGKNGIGKTTILNYIYNKVKGFVGDEVIILKKYKTIVICTRNKDIVIENKNTLEKEFGYKFIIKNEGLILDVVPINNRGADYKQEVMNMVYISDFIDPSISTSSTMNEEDFNLNFSPEYLINNPNSFLNYSLYNINNLKMTVQNYKLINYIHQIQFFKDFNGLLDLCINLRKFTIGL